MRDKTGMGDRMSVKVGKGLRPKVILDGICHIKVCGPDGRLKDERRVRNRVVEDGEEYLIDLWQAHENGVGLPTAMSRMKLGTGVTGAVEGDVKVETYQAGSVNAFDSITQATAQKISYVSTWSGAQVWAITEAVITSSTADSSTEDGTNGNRILSRATFAVINKAADDSIEITWNIELQSQA